MKSTQIPLDNVKTAERISLGWRVATVFMVLGVPAIVFGSWVFMTAINADKDVHIEQIHSKLH